MRNSETVFLQFVAGKGSRYKMMLSVIIPIAVWRQIAGTAEPGSFKGKIHTTSISIDIVDALHFLHPTHFVEQQGRSLQRWADRSH
jgi:hypothetical protein